MKLTVSLLLLVAVCHISEVNSSRSLPKTEGEVNPTVKRTLLDPGYGLEAALYKKGLVHPGLGHIDPHHHHAYAGLHHNPHLAHAALAGLYGPLSPYHHLKLDYSPYGHLGYHHGHHDNSDNDERDNSDEERESERPKSEKSSKKSKSKKSKRPSSKSSSRSEKNEEKHRSHHDHDEHKYLEYTHLGYPHPLLYANHHLYPHLRAGLHLPYHQPLYQPHLGLGHAGLYNPYLQPVQYVQHSVEQQQVIPGAQYQQDGQPQQIQQQVQPQIQQPIQPQQQQQQQLAPPQQNPQAQAQNAVNYASYSQSLPQSYQPQLQQPVIQGQLYPQQLQVLQTQPLFQLLGVEPVNFQQTQLLVPTPVPQQSLQSQPPNLFPESPQPVTQAPLLQPIPTQPTVQTTTLVASPSEESPVVTIKPSTQATSTSTQQVIEIQPPKASELELKQEADNSINSSRAYLTPLFSQTQEVVIQDSQLPAVSTIAPAYYGK